MKHILQLCVVLALSSGSLIAQTTFHLQGILKKTDRTPVDFANVLLRSPKDSTLITGIVSDQEGKFRLEASTGTYLLEVRALGFQKLYKTLTVSGAMDLGEILLTEEAKELSAVQVTGKRPIMLRKVDRMVFDATQIAPAAASALDVLRQTPGLNVTETGISIIGKGAVIILINDKRVRLSGTALISLLRSYPQTDLTEIQILTSPPAKYEAEGNAGVLNLVFKKAKQDYFGGSISPNVSVQDDWFNYRVNAGLNYQQGKVSASLQLGGGQPNYTGDFNTYRTYPIQHTYSSSETKVKIKNKNFSIRGSMDYAFTPELTLGFNISFNPERSNPRRENDTRDYTIAPDGSYQLQRVIPGLADETEKTIYSSANVHLEKTFKGNRNKRFNWDLDYVGYRSEEGRNFSSQSFGPTGATIPGSAFRFNSLADQHTDSYITSIDYTAPLGRGSIGLGAKGTWTRTQNTNDYDALSTTGERHDKILFDEHVYALYADLKHPLSSKWSLRSGLRMEYTHTEGESNGRRLEHLRSYLNVFPTLYIGFNPNDRHAFNLNSTIRLQRPHFSALSPFPRYENQNSTLIGKEDLRASKRATLGIGYTFLGALNFELSGGYAWDGITQVVRLDPATNLGSYTHENAEKTYTFGLENSFFFNQVSFFQTYISQRVWYADTRIEDQSARLYGGTGWAYYLNLNNTFFFNRSKTFQGTCYLFYSSPRYEGGFRVKHVVYTGAGLSYTLLKGKLRIAADVYNLLAQTYKISVTTPQYDLQVRNFNYRTFSLGVTYSFGASIKGREGSKNAQELRSRM